MVGASMCVYVCPPIHLEVLILSEAEVRDRALWELLHASEESEQKQEKEREYLSDGIVRHRHSRDGLSSTRAFLW